MHIEDWLTQFKAAWQTHDVPRVLALFDKRVEYYESPFRKLSNTNDLKLQWQEIIKQRNIQLDLKLFCHHGPKSTVIWYLKYTDDQQQPREYAGTFLITLNDQGKCVSFFQTFQTNQ